MAVSVLMAETAFRLSASLTVPRFSVSFLMASDLVLLIYPMHLKVLILEM
jgi:hypothetical protein